MAKIELIMPKMGESIMEATIIKWLKKEGDQIEMDEAVLEIATDKVDSEVPAPEDCVMGEILFQEDDIVEVGAVIAYLYTEGDSPSADSSVKEDKEEVPAEVLETVAAPLAQSNVAPGEPLKANSNGKFFSPLVLSMAKAEGVSMAELDNISGSGKNGRVTKRDMQAYLSSRLNVQPSKQTKVQTLKTSVQQTVEIKQPSVDYGKNYEIEEMDRMRRLIADHMVMSKRVSPHVTSYVEADVTKLVNWRNKIKNKFQQQYGTKITFTHIFIEAVRKAIQDFPKINSSVDGYKQIIKKDINIGVATALPSGNLIVPVIKNADMLSLAGIVKQMNELVDRARNNKLKPDDTQGGTFTLTNVGSFGNVMGAPIINQPQVAIMSTGIIKKKPVVMETEMGDIIAIRQMMFLSLSYDHRVVDGMLGGSFLRRVADYLEQFDDTQGV